MVAVVGSFPQDDPTTIIQVQPGPHKVLPVKAKAAVTELAVVVVGADKMAVQEAQLLVEMMVLFQVKMATVWHPEAVLFLVVRMAVGAE